MKKYVIAILLFICSVGTNGQVNIGESLFKIKLEDSSGTLQKDPDGKGLVYICNSKELGALFTYFLDENFICYATGVRPNSKEILKVWVNNLNENKDWVKKNRKFWVMDRKVIFVDCMLTKDNQKNPLLIFLARKK